MCGSIRDLEAEHTARNGGFRGCVKVLHPVFDVKELRILENLVSKRIGMRIDSDSLSPAVLSLLVRAFEDGRELSYREMMQIVAELLCSSGYSRRDLLTLMKRLGVDDSEMQADLIYMARSWRSRDPFTYNAAYR